METDKLAPEDKKQLRFHEKRHSFSEYLVVGANYQTKLEVVYEGLAKYTEQSEEIETVDVLKLAVWHI